MKKLLTAIAVTTVLSTTATAGTLVQQSGVNWSDSISMTESYSTTKLKIREEGFATDSNYGGGDYHCQGLQCDKADNRNGFREVTEKRTDLTIDTQGLSTSVNSTSGSFSGGSVNGLKFQEAWSVSESETMGVSLTRVEGKVKEVKETWSGSTNGGNENGVNYKYEKSVTDVTEFTDTTFSGGSEVVTFTSSIGN